MKSNSKGYNKRICKLKIRVKKLTVKQVIGTYRLYLTKDFPREERRPLHIMLWGMVTGHYECLGAFYEGRMLGYAFLVKHNSDYLLDYLAVNRKMRDKGIGTFFLKRIMEYYKDADSVICEVEDPDTAKDEAERVTRERRIDFYLRSGCIDTTVRTRTFGVDFIILRVAGRQQDAKTVKELYKTHYGLYLSERMYRKNIHIRGAL